MMMLLLLLLLLCLLFVLLLLKSFYCRLTGSAFLSRNIDFLFFCILRVQNVKLVAIAVIGQNSAEIGGVGAQLVYH
jgi:hypothetical protein